MTVVLAQLGGLEASLLQRFDGAAPVAVLLVVALVVGAAHGLAPGHGKTLGAAHLAGPEATVGHAVGLAVAIAAMHSASVVVLATTWWLVAGDGLDLGAVTRWGQLAVALLVLGIGLQLTHRRWQAHRRGVAVEDRGHPDAYGRSNGHHHLHLGPPWSRAGLTSLAAAGGLLPSPSAFLVLVSGLATGRAAVAFVAVLAFGTGLGGTVLATGLVTLAGRDWLWARARRTAAFARFLRLAPLLGAVAVVAVGLAAVITATVVVTS